MTKVNCITNKGKVYPTIKGNLGTKSVNVNENVIVDGNDNVSSDVILTPYKYNGGQLYVRRQNPKNKLLIGVDWFECTVNGSFLDNTSNPTDILSFSDGDIVLLKDELRPNGTKHFQYCYEVYLHGERFGLVNTVPRSSVLNDSLSIIKVDNHILYQRGWVARLEFIMNELGVVLHNVTRLDIAIDGGDFLKDYTNLISGKYTKVGRATMQTQHTHNGSVQGFYIGTRSSEKYIRGYNKTLELKKSCNKGYISDFWADNGLVGDNIERLEITLKRKAMQRIVDFDMGKLEDSGYLAGIMCSQMQKLYVLVPSGGDSNVTRKTKIQVVDWSFFDAKEVLRRSKVKSPSVVWAVQRAVSFEMRESYSGLEDLGVNLWEQAYTRSYSRCEKYGILDWFTTRLPKWEKEKDYHAIMRKRYDSVRQVRFNMKNSAAFTEV